MKWLPNPVAKSLINDRCYRENRVNVIHSIIIILLSQPGFSPTSNEQSFALHRRRVGLFVHPSQWDTMLIRRKRERDAVNFFMSS
jgi:hypothetical protein